VAGGLQLASACPELEDTFVNHEHIFYYQKPDDLCTMIRYIIDNEEKANHVRSNGHQLALRDHTYIQRVPKLLS
jgi:spore maturation protein CgeB